jgi:pantetheine-phosphate adenylyltransferase
MEGVREFLQLFRPQIEHDVVPISDVYGPTAVDSNIQALVVSKETLSGAEASECP